MFRKAVIAAAVAVSLALTPGTSLAAGAESFTPGAPGVGDPYFPLDGNGGYDVRHYLLEVKYTPQTDVLAGVATITARATQNLSSFNLDLDGLTVRSIRVDGRPASFTRDGGELTVKPRSGLRQGSTFTTVVSYDGVPDVVTFVHTDDGAVIMGEPHIASWWFPVNDHPTDKAAYTFKVTVPAGTEAVANGELVDRKTVNGWTTWTWDARAPMASYLATATMGDFDLRQYRANGIKFWDALDPDLFDELGVEPRTGQRFAISQKDSSSYKRLSRTITVPAAGANLSFWVTRDTEADWDFMFVEARTAGAEDWTTLPDLNGHTSANTGQSCLFGWHDLHPFLTHYQTLDSDGTCVATGTSGTWSAASGASSGYEQWSVDLSGYAGTDVEVSISYASDWGVQAFGLFVDDITVSTGAGSTSFEDDGDVMDGWTVPGPPARSGPNLNDWMAGTVENVPRPDGELVDTVFARQPEAIEFMAGLFGPYPFSASGGIVDDTFSVAGALENQTRPIYGRSIFGDPVQGTSVLVHELAHQWFGNSVSLAGWRHLWLNEGFATYAEWLWSEHKNLGTAQQIFDATFRSHPQDDPFWKVIVDDPVEDPSDPDDVLFEPAVYDRGAMTLHQLRLAVGDASFFQILRLWTARFADGNATTDQFIAHAEQISGRQLDELFKVWLSTPQRPTIPGASNTAPPTTFIGPGSITRMPGKVGKASRQ
jgi:hypothetical protein